MCVCTVAGYVGHVGSSGGQVPASSGQSAQGGSARCGGLHDPHLKQGETPGEANGRVGVVQVLNDLNGDETGGESVITASRCIFFFTVSI